MQADMLHNPKCNLQMNKANYAWTNGHIDFKIRKKKVSEWGKKSVSE